MPSGSNVQSTFRNLQLRLSEPRDKERSRARPGQAQPRPCCLLKSPLYTPAKRLSACHVSGPCVAPHQRLWYQDAAITSASGAKCVNSWQILASSPALALNALEQLSDINEYFIHQTVSVKSLLLLSSLLIKYEWSE